MSTTAETLIARCAEDLLDPDYDRWGEPDWLEYLNAGERQLVYFKPSSYSITDTFKLVEGIEQELPSGAIELLDILRNMGTDGTTPSSSILRVDPKDLDEAMPDWRSETSAATVVHYMFNPDLRTKFQVYPPQPSSNMGYVEAVYSSVPSTIESVGDDINLGDEYQEPLKNYMKFRALSIDAQVSEAAYRRAMDAYNLFVSQIGRKDLVETRLPARRGSHGNRNQPIS